MGRYLLAIETSCDECSIAIISDEYDIIAHEVATQLEHSQYGGVVPELAARKHYEMIGRVFQKVCKESGLTVDDMEAIAVTRGPGLVGSLLVGLSFAKGLAYAYKKPLYGIHHIEGHLTSVLLTEKDIPLPALGVAVSGGHTHIYIIREWGIYELIARTRDDAIGEAYDKVAKLLGLGYPGGPIIDKLASSGEATYQLPIPVMRDDSLDMSYSGLKTAVLHIVKKDRERFIQKDDEKPQDLLNLLASFQKAAIAQVLDRIEKASQKHNVRSLIVVGGVSANSLLREEVRRLGKTLNIPVYLPPLRFCMDNAAMIGVAGWIHVHREEPPELDTLDALPRWELAVAGTV